MKFSRLAGPMLASLTLLLVLGSGAAFGQTYVRPSKGAAFNPFVGQRLDSNSSLVSSVYDWTAFSSARVQVFGIGTGQNGTGVLCTSVTPVDHVFNNTNNYIKFVVQRTFSQSEIYLMGSGTKDGTFGVEYQNGYYAVTRYEEGSNVGNYTKFGNCDVGVLVTPLPFESTNSELASNAVVSELLRMSSSDCYPGQENIISQAVGPTAWTKITAGYASTSVCNSVLNSFGPVYCVMYDDTVGSPALVTPPHTLLPGAYVIPPGECRKFGPPTELSSNGISSILPTPWCASADAVSVGVRRCPQARIHY